MTSVLDFNPQDIDGCPEQVCHGAALSTAWNNLIGVQPAMLRSTCGINRSIGGSIGRYKNKFANLCSESAPQDPSCGIGCSTSDDCSGDDGGCNTCMPSGEGGVLTCTRQGTTYNPVSGQSQCSDGTTFTPLSDGQTQCTA